MHFRERSRFINEILHMKKLRLLSYLSTTTLLLSGYTAHAQNSVYHGNINSQKDSLAIAGATILIGDSVVAHTASDGSFSFQYPAQDSLPMVINAPGFNVVTYPAGSFPRAIYMTPFGDKVMDDVIVIGYGSSKKKYLTGSVATISSKDFNGGAISTPEQLIQGKIPGVQITSNGGQPGAGSKIRIRGGASLNASNDPLIVVDGVPLNMSSVGNVANPLSMINPDDIATFTVLKDANATAIYGSRASNGVILITTKQGRSGKPVFNFTTTNSLSQAYRFVPVLSANQLRAYVHEYGTQAQINMLGTANTDWQKEIYRKAFSTINNLSVSGAINKWLPYRVSTGFTDQSGILKRDNMKRVTFSVNLTPQFFDHHLKVNLNIKNAYTRSFFANQSAIGAAIQFDPTQSVYDSSSRYGGYFEWMSNPTTLNPNAPRNPVSLLNSQTNIGNAYRSIGNLQLDYQVHFLPDLHVHTNFGYDIASSNGHVYVPADAGMAYTTKGTYQQSKNKYNNYVVEAYLDYTKDLTALNSHINVIAGYGYYANETRNYNYATYAADSTTVLVSPTYPMDLQQNRLLSYYGRGEYIFADKYIFSATVRRDGSSKFSPQNRYGVFPSFGFTWRAIDENFMKSQNVFSDLKFRLTYGKTGQQDGIANYSYQGIYYANQPTGQYQIGGNFYNYYSPSAYVANLKWESTQTYNAGVDFGIFNNFITGSFDYYYKKTSNLLSSVPISVGTNYSNYVTTNVGNMNNNGFELNLNANLIQNKDVHWTVGYNLFMYKSIVKNLSLNPDPSYMVSTGGITGATGNYISAHALNQWPYSFYVYKQVYGSDGKPLEGVYADLNGDGTITSADKYFYHNPAPKATMGFSTSFSYKKWSASTVLRAQLGNYVYNNVQANFSTRTNVLSPSGLINNATTDIYNTGFVSPQYLSDYYIQNASFLRMTNFVVGYNFGRISKTNKNVKLNASASVQNAFLITNYKGVDPESANNGIDMNFYPNPRTYALTLGLTF